MRILGQSRLTERILFWVICASVLMFSVVTTLTVWQEREGMFQAAQEDADRNVSRNIASISIALWNFDKTTLDTTLLGLTQSGPIIRAEVWDLQRQIAQVERADQSRQADFEWEVPIMGPDNSRPIGTLKISESYADVRAFFEKSLPNELISELTKIAGLAALLFVVIYSVIARHLKTLAREVSKLKPGDVRTPVRLQRKKVYHDELDTLVESINRFRSEGAEAQDALWATRLELARVTQLTTMGQMAASIAHEINQPLAAIVANSSAGLRWLGRDPPEVEEARAALKDIADNGHRAGEVIGSIRAMFKKNSHERMLMDLNQLIRDVLAMVDADLRAQRVSVFAELREGLPQVLADRVQIQQVLLNLILNAVEAMRSVSDGERLIKISSDIREISGILVTVEDSGTGIEVNDLERIFDAFFTTKPNGMGMGLSICQSIIESHDGHLWASPGIACGSIFHFALPEGARGAASRAVNPRT
jgi:C4-dicarboxylate-specific signal transduction histidine kinase